MSLIDDEPVELSLLPHRSEAFSELLADESLRSGVEETRSRMTGGEVFCDLVWEDQLRDSGATSIEMGERAHC